MSGLGGPARAETSRLKWDFEAQVRPRRPYLEDHGTKQGEKHLNGGGYE